ncbi:MAG: DUF4281 domain-containing protein [Caldilineaceae bacterium]|nr:DUF4281 domain-containing protein [Caldilineaceae bacterium]
MYEQLFQLSNLLIMPFWILLILLPHWRWTGRIISSPWIAAPPALLYAILVVPGIAGLLAELANPELTQIAELLGTAPGATIAWAHFVTFDLFVGRWVFLDSRQRRITAWLASPILFCVLMFGPLGFLLYLLVRVFFAKPTIDQATAA